jgi:signal transduction histidine kinase
VWVPQRERVGSDRVARTERAITRLHALILASLGALGLLVAGAPAGGPLLVWLSGSLWILVAVDVLARGERPVHLPLLLTALAAGSWAQADVVPGALPAGLAVGIFGLSAARLLQAPAFQMAMLAAAGTSIGITAYARPSVLMSTVDDAVLSVSMALAIRALLRTVNSTAEKLRDADECLASARMLEAAAIADRAATERVARALHDDVLTALRGIASGWPADVARRDARHAVEAIARAAAPAADGARGIPADAGDLGTLVRDVTSRSPVEVALEIHGDPRDAALQPPHVEALSRAIGESLRNVARHAGTTHATLRLDIGTAALGAAVIDHGQLADGSVAPGFGLRTSVREPLEQVGGTVRFEPTVGGGLTVAMNLPYPRGRREGRLARAYRQTMTASQLQARATSLVLPLAAAYSYIAARNSSAWPEPAASWLVLIGMTAVLAVLVRRLRAQPPTARWLAGVGASLSALTAFGLAAAPPGAMLDFRGWPVGYAAVIASMLLLVVPAPVGLAVIAPLPAVVVVAQRLDPGLSDGSAPWSAVNAALMLPLGLLGVGVALRRVGRRIDADLATAARLWLEDAGRRAAARVAEVHLANTRARVAPWLRAIADGSVSPESPDAAAFAEVLALEVRDDLYAPGFFTDELRDAVGRFRRRGGHVRIRPTGMEQSKHAAGVLLRALVEHLDAPCRLTLSFGNGVDPRQGWRLVTVPEAPEAALELAGPYRVVSDGDRTVIQAR